MNAESKFKSPWDRIYQWSPIALALICLTSSWLSFSPSLDDQDSALLMAGVEEFDLLQQRPHPPGYPIYILCCRLAAKFCGDIRQGMIIVSVLGAALSAFLLPLVFRQLGAAKKLAPLLACAVLVCPVVAMTNAKILTDSLGFAVYLGLLLWVLKDERAGFFFGLSITVLVGIRPHAVLVLLPLILLSRPKARLLGAFSGLTVMLLVMAYVEGFGNLGAAMQDQIMKRFNTPDISVFSPETSVHTPVSRGLWFLVMFFRELFGPDRWRYILPLMSVLALALSFLWFHRPGPDAQDQLKARRLLLLGSCGYLVFLYLFLPAHPRYLLPTIPLFVLALSFNRAWVIALFIVLAIPFTTQRLVTLSTHQATPDLAIKWMDAHDPNQALPLLSPDIWSHARVLCPQRKVQRGFAADFHDLPSGRFFSDSLAIGKHAEIPNNGFRLVTAKTFERDVHIHDKYMSLTIQLFEKRN